MIQTLLTACYIPLVGVMASDAGTAPPHIDRFGFYEATFQSQRDYDNPYTEVEAEARLQCPDGTQRRLPLFWDGGRQWKLRLSPDVEGLWKFRIRSSDPDLNKAQGSVLCVASKRAGGIRPSPRDPHHFERQGGTPFLFWGDTAWALYLDNQPEQLNRESALHYVDLRAAEGITVVHSMLLSEAGWGNSGGPPLRDMQREQINPAYWQEVDRRVRYVNDKGITAGLVLGWGDKGAQEPFAWRRFPSAEARRRYARYVAARYGAADVYFVVAGEWHAEIRSQSSTEAAVRQQFNAIGDALAEVNAHQRMIAIHPMTAHGSTREFNDTKWMSFGDYQQNYTDLHQRVLQSRDANQPVVNSEYGYYLRDSSGDGKVDKHNSFSAEDMRYATWDIVMAGGYPITGYGTTYMGGHRDPGPFHPDDPRNTIWTQQYHAARKFFAQLDWWKLQPHDELVSCQQPRGQDRTTQVRMSATATRRVQRPPIRTYWLLAQPGSCYVVYARGLNVPVSIELAPSAPGPYRAARFDPRNGTSIAVEVQQGGQVTWTPPDQQDWVLLLTKAK